MNVESEIVDALVDAAHRMQGEDSVQTTIDTVAAVALRVIRWADASSILSADDAHTVTAVGGGQDLGRLHRRIHRSDERPGVTALEERRTITVPSMDHEERWPEYVAEARRLGVKALVAVPLLLDDSAGHGVLNLYSFREEGVPQEVEAAAANFAGLAAIALDRATEIAQLETALESRRLIGEAVGIVMARYRIDDQAAFAVLVRRSTTSNVKLRRIAEEIVGKTNAAAEH